MCVLFSAPGLPSGIPSNASTSCPTGYSPLCGATCICIPWANSSGNSGSLPAGSNDSSFGTLGSTSISARQARSGASCSDTVTCFFVDQLPYALSVLGLCTLIVLIFAYCIKRRCCPQSPCIPPCLINCLNQCCCCLCRSKTGTTTITSAAAGKTSKKQIRSTSASRASISGASKELNRRRVRSESRNNNIMSRIAREVDYKEWDDERGENHKRGRERGRGSSNSSSSVSQRSKNMMNHSGSHQNSASISLAHRSLDTSSPNWQQRTISSDPLAFSINNNPNDLTFSRTITRTLHQNSDTIPPWRLNPLRRFGVLVVNDDTDNNDDGNISQSWEDNSSGNNDNLHRRPLPSSQQQWTPRLSQRDLPSSHRRDSILGAYRDSRGGGGGGSAASISPRRDDRHHHQYSPDYPNHQEIMVIDSPRHNNFPLFQTAAMRGNGGSGASGAESISSNRSPRRSIMPSGSRSVLQTNVTQSRRLLH